MQNSETKNPSMSTMGNKIGNKSPTGKLSCTLPEAALRGAWLPAVAAPHANGAHAHSE